MSKKRNVVTIAVDRQNLCNDGTVMYLDDKPPTLKESRDFIGGYVQLVTLPDQRQMLIDEEGLLKELPTNYLASILYGGVIVGKVIILSGKALW